MTAAIQGHFPEFSASPGEENVAEDRPDGLDERLAAMADELGPERFKRLRSRNQLDMKFWQHAGARLDELLQSAASS